jgi:hypothetical protein
MLIAERKHRPIDADALWQQFGEAIAKDGSTAVSTILDMARHFGIARKLDVIQNIDRAGLALEQNNTAGVLVASERFQIDDSAIPSAHMMALSSIARHRENHQQYISVVSANAGQDSEVFHIPADRFVSMGSCFLILYD